MTEKKTYHITVLEVESGKIILDTDSAASILRSLESMEKDNEGTAEPEKADNAEGETE